MASAKGVIRFAGFEFDLGRTVLAHEGQPISAEPKVLTLLQFLLDNNGRVVETSEIMAGVWPDSVTTPGSLSRAVSLARAALAEHSPIPAVDILQTVRGRGYRIGVPITFADSSEEPILASVFIGRESTLTAIDASIERLGEGASELIIVSGEAGIGKTRLAEEVARSARRRGAEVLWGRCREDGGGPAYGPWTELLRSHVSRRGVERVRGDANGDLDVLCSLLPELGSGSEPLAPLALSGSERSLQLAAVNRLLARAAESRPVLLVLEDVHIADEASLLLLRGLVEMSRAKAIGFLLTYRSAELSDSKGAVDTLVRLAQLIPERVDVSLEGLTFDETRLFVAQRVATEWNRSELEVLHERSDGSPFFIQELIRHREEGGGRDLPETTRLVLQSRFSELSERVRTLLQMASVIGREFRLSDLAHALGERTTDTTSGLGEAEARRLIEVGSGIDGECRFTHALVREAIYEGLRSDERARLHQSVGDTLFALYGMAENPPLDDLARHYAEAGSRERALAFSVAAAERARQYLAFESAVDSFGQALRILASMPPVDQARECDLLLDLGNVLHRSGRITEAMETVLRAIEIARHIGAVESFALGACTLSFWRNDNIGVVPTERLALLEEALTMLPAEDSSLRARVLTSLSADLYWSDEFERSDSLSKEAVEVAERVGDASTRFVALYQRFDLLSGPEYGAEVDGIHAECLRLAKQLRNAEYEFLARQRIWERHVIKAEPTEIDQVLNDCEKLADRLHQPRFSGAVDLMTSARELWRGDLAAARARLPNPEEARLEDASSAIQSIVLIPRLFLVLRMEGRLEALERIVRAGVERFPRLYALRCALGLYCALTGRVEEARALLDELARNDFSGLRPDVNLAINLAVLSETTSIVGDRARAERLVEQLRPFAGSHMITGAYMSLGSADRYLGLLETTRGRFDEAAEHFEEALRIETRMNAAPWRAWAERDYARMLVARNGGQINPEAKRHFETASAIEAAIREG